MAREVTVKRDEKRTGSAGNSAAQIKEMVTEQEGCCAKIPSKGGSPDRVVEGV